MVCPDFTQAIDVHWRSRRINWNPLANEAKTPAWTR
ncbi:hypothetical protein F0726_02435 [Acidithiobacillus caldus]|nr:hypothetical protein F0726_02435 [Acidithiobacillus caldus]